jgi:hypothetical protein
MNERFFFLKKRKERITVLDPGSELVGDSLREEQKKKGTTDHSTKERDTCERA